MASVADYGEDFDMDTGEQMVGNSKGTFSYSVPILEIKGCC